MDAVFETIRFVFEEAVAAFTFPKHRAISRVCTSPEGALLNDLASIFLALNSNGRNRYLSHGDTVVFHLASVRLDGYDVGRGR